MFKIPLYFFHFLFTLMPLYDDPPNPQTAVRQPAVVRGVERLVSAVRLAGDPLHRRHRHWPPPRQQKPHRKNPAVHLRPQKPHCPRSLLQ